MKKFLSVLLAIMLMTGLTACGSNSDNESTSPAASTPAESNASDALEETAATGSVFIEHDFGTTEVAINPEKVVVLDLGLVDIFDNVDLPIGGLPNSNLPAYLSKYEGDEYINMGTLKEIDFEALNEYEPELILITGRLSDAYDECSEIAPTIYMGNASLSYMDSIKQNAETLAKIFPAKADNIMAAYDQIESDAAELKADAEASGLDALIIMANDGSLSFFGAGSRYDVIHNEFGFAPADENVDDSTHGQEGSYEYISQTDPAIIFVIDRSAAIGTEGATGAESLLDNKLVDGTKAAQNGKVVYLSSDIWYLATGGFTGTAKMIEEVKAALAE